MDLYYLALSPPARAVYATALHLGLDVNLKEVDLMGGANRTEEYLKLNPAHQVPTLVDNGFVLGESRAIMCYLANKYSGSALYPTSPEERAKVDRMLYFDGTNLYPNLKSYYMTKKRYQKEPTADQIQDVKNAISELIALKGSNKFMAGDNVSLADISLSMAYTFLQLIFTDDVKPLEQWYKDVEAAIPSVKKVNDAVDYSFFKKL